jgi:hypothetical protein
VAVAILALDNIDIKPVLSNPVLSGVYDLIKGKSVDGALPLWKKFISVRDVNHNVYLLADPSTDDLCEEEEEIIQEVYGQDC